MSRDITFRTITAVRQTDADQNREVKEAAKYFRQTVERALVDKQEQSEDKQTYRIVRFCFDFEHPDHRKVIASGLSLAEVQAHCKREDTHGDDWFDGFEAE